MTCAMTLVMGRNYDIHNKLHHNIHNNIQATVAIIRTRDIAGCSNSSLSKNINNNISEDISSSNNGITKIQNQNRLIDTTVDIIFHGSNGKKIRRSLTEDNIFVTNSMNRKIFASSDSDRSTVALTPSGVNTNIKWNNSSNGSPDISLNNVNNLTTTTKLSNIVPIQTNEKINTIGTHPASYNGLRGATTSDKRIVLTNRHANNNNMNRITINKNDVTSSVGIDRSQLRVSNNFNTVRPRHIKNVNEHRQRNSENSPRSYVNKIINQVHQSAAGGLSSFITAANLPVDGHFQVIGGYDASSARTLAADSVGSTKGKTNNEHIYLSNIQEINGEKLETYGRGSAAPPNTGTVLGSVSPTLFSCKGRPPGHYADTDANCQVRP